MTDDDPTGWHLLLARLDPQPRAAAARYRELRAQLITTFRRTGLPVAEDLADEAIERAVGCLEAGEDIRCVAAFVHGVARRLAFERRRQILQVVALQHEPAAEPGDGDPRPDRLETLERALDALPEPTRELLLQYHAGGQRSRIDRRKQIAERQGGVNALRVRIHRLRRELRATLEQACA